VVGRQQVGGGVDRGLHLLLGDVQRQAELELQRDDRSAAGTLGGHLLQARHLAKLALQRGGNGRGHHVRAGTRIERHHLNGGVIHFRQGGDRQEAVANDPRQQDRHHQQGGGDRAQDKQT